MVREIIKLGYVPSPSCITSPNQVESCADSAGESINCLRNEENPIKPKNLKKIVRAYHKAKHTALRYLIFLVTISSQFRKKIMMIEVATYANEKQHNAKIFEINGWFRKSQCEVLSIDHNGSG